MDGVNGAVGTSQTDVDLGIPEIIVAGHVLAYGEIYEHRCSVVAVIMFGSDGYIAEPRLVEFKDIRMCFICRIVMTSVPVFDLQKDIVQGRGECFVGIPQIMESVLSRRLFFYGKTNVSVPGIIYQ